MALSNQSTFLYNFTVTSTNQYMSFATSSGEIPPSSRTAVLNVGFYSLSSLLVEVARAITAADPLHIYSVTADRTIANGTQNRITIATNNTYFGIYFATGNPSNPATLLGFNNSDYTGLTSYTGSTTSGTILVPNMNGYNYTPPGYMQKNFGTINVSASGIKESIVFSLQQFSQIQFKYIPQATATNQWNPFIIWMIQQREFDFTPDYTDPTTVYEVTLEDPNQGMMLNLTEHISEGLPGFWYTPLLKFRLVNIGVGT